MGAFFIKSSDEIGESKTITSYKLGMEPLIVYTIGHSNRNISDFIYILRKFNIELLVDIRTYPYSKFASDYNKEILFRSLKGNNIEYLYRGDTLGGCILKDLKDISGTQKYFEALLELLRHT